MLIRRALDIRAEASLSNRDARVTRHNNALYSKGYDDYMQQIVTVDEGCEYYVLNSLGVNKVNPASLLATSGGGWAQLNYNAH